MHFIPMWHVCMHEHTHTFMEKIQWKSDERHELNWTKEKLRLIPLYKFPHYTCQMGATAIPVMKMHILLTQFAKTNFVFICVKNMHLLHKFHTHSVWLLGVPHPFYIWKFEFCSNYKCHIKRRQIFLHIAIFVWNKAASELRPWCRTT